MPLTKVCPLTILSILHGSQFWGSRDMCLIFCFCKWWGRSLNLQVWYCPMTQSILNLKWESNLAILVQQLCIRLKIPLHLHLHGRMFCCLIKSLSWVYRWGINQPISNLKLGSEDYTFLDQAVDVLEHGVDSIKCPELYVSFDEADTGASSVCSGFLHSIIIISNNSKLKLAPSTKSSKLWCQTRGLLLPVSLTGMMSASKHIHYFLSNHATFDFGFLSLG